MTQRLDRRRHFLSKAPMARTPPIVALQGVRLTLGAAPLFEGVDLSLFPGERTALVGRNGAGKSTLMRILSGAADADGGEIFRQPGASIRWLPQEPVVTGFARAHDYVAHGLSDMEIYRADTELAEWEVDPDLNPATASGGQIRRIALARAFAEEPDVLLLDEPTNHLDVDAIEQLEGRLKSFRGAVLLVSHDRRFLQNVSTSVAWLRQGVVRQMDKGYAHFETWSESIEEAEERNLEKLETQLKAEERWMSRGVTARRKRNMGRVRKLHEMRDQRRSAKVALADAAAGANLVAAEGTASGRLVIDAKGVSKAFGDNTLIRDLDLRIMRGDRLGVIGPNGAGKTTLLRVLLGIMPPDSGTVRLAQTLTIAFLDQMRASLKSDVTIWEAMAPLGGDSIVVRGHSRHVAAYAKDFLFTSAQLRQPVGKLSGGERNRLSLALALARPSNVLVLDEPTNDLDIETLDLLEDMLADYEGTLLVVSHDRAFLDGVATSILSPLGEGRWLETPGGYSDYLTQRGELTAAVALRTKSVMPPVSTAAAPRPQTKLSFKDTHRLKELDSLMPRLQAEIVALEDAMADSALFNRDPKAYQARANRLTAARAELEAAEVEWLGLEEKREALK
jgi:ATP-binding cassette subfamily F protein uup